MRRVGSLLAVCLGLSACVGTLQSGDVGSSRPQRCEPARKPVPDPDGSKLRALAWLTQRFPIAGRYGEPGAMALSPSNAPAVGELAVELAANELTHLRGCGQDRIEARVRVRLHTDDGALDEALEGSAFVGPELLEPAEPNVSYNQVAVLAASLDMHALHGGLSWNKNEWRYDAAQLHATLTPFGSFGELHASPTSKRTPGELPNQPPALLDWPSPRQCSETEEAFTPTQGDAERTLATRIAELADHPVRARYQRAAGPAAAETKLDFDFEPLGEVCGYGRRTTRAHLRSADGRVDLALDAALDLTFPSPLFVGANYERPAAYTPAAFGNRVGRVGAPLEGFDRIGVKLWYVQDPDKASVGELEVLGWAETDCLRCEGDTCGSCSSEHRTVILAITLGECRPGSTRPHCTP